MKSKRSKIISKLRNKHRFVLINDESFAEVASVRLTLLNVLSIFSGLLILFSLVFYWIFSYTPVQNLLPKELPSSARSEILELHEQLDELKNQVEIRNSKAEVLNNLLSGKESLYDSTSQRQNPANN